MIKNVLADGLDEYAVNLKRVMDPVWQSEFPDAPETVDDSQHVGEYGRGLLKGDGPASGRPPRDVHKRAAAAR